MLDAGAQPGIGDRGLPGCVLGLYSDQEIEHTSGSIPPGTPTDLYLGIKFDARGQETGLTGVECSVSGLTAAEGFTLVGVDPIVPGIDLCPDPPSPGDPPCIAFELHLSWPTCRVGSQALMRLTLIGLGPNSDKVFQVGPAHPPTLWNAPVITRCDPPTFTAVRVTGGCFVANPTGTQPPCAVGVEPSDWTGIKELFR